MKKCKWFMVLATLSFLLVLFGFNNTQVSARRHYVTIPTNLRGTWYQYDKDTNSFATLKLTKYTWHIKRPGEYDVTVSGKHFMNAHQSSCSLISKKYNNHGYWDLSLNQSSMYMLLKRTTTTHSGKGYVALHEYLKYPQTHFTTWTHHKFK